MTHKQRTVSFVVKVNVVTVQLYVKYHVMCCLLTIHQEHYTAYYVVTKHPQTQRKSMRQEFSFTSAAGSCSQNVQNLLGETRT